MSVIPVLEHVDSFTVTGLSTRTRNTDEFNEKTAKLPSLWQQFYTSGLATNTTLLEVYSEYESDANGFYTVTLGVTGDNLSAEFNTVIIPTGNFLVFSGEGPMPTTVIETWKQVWAYFETENQYTRRFISDFEVYTGAEKVAIYIGIE